MARPTVAAVTERAERAEASLELVQESLADLELALDDTGWSRIVASLEREFTRDGLRKAADVARVYAVANPLIRRGLGVRSAYIHGGGVSISARAAGQDSDEDVNAVVQAFIDAPRTRAVLTGDTARDTLERALGTDGNIFAALFTNPTTGRVQPRILPFAEITAIWANPDDSAEPWYYLRTFEAPVSLGSTSTQRQQVLYPDVSYAPASRPGFVNGIRVRWDAPVRHVAVNRQDGWQFGIGDAYSALTWARSYRDFLGDWATLVKALSQFAWRATPKTRSQAQAARTALARRTTDTAPDSNPNTVGATVNLPADIGLEAIPKTGATIDSESGRPLAAMVAAGLDVSVVTLLADPGVSGARAVAETLDKPTENAMRLRQSVWTDLFRDVLGYVIARAVEAPQGPLRGQVLADTYTGGQTIILAGDTDPTVEIVWPDLTETGVETIVKAIAVADATGKLPPLTVARLLLEALRVKDVDEVLEAMTDEDGNFIDPDVSAGSVALDRFERGQS